MWVKLDNGIATHPKILTAGPLALAIQIRAICYASQNQTDGFLPTNAIPLLLTGLDQIDIETGSITGSEGQPIAGFGTTASDLDWPHIMVTAGLWDAEKNGYMIHDYLQWNLSKKQYESMKKKLSSAGKKGMKSRWMSHNQGYKGGNNLSDNLPITVQSISTSLLSSLSSSESSSDLQSNAHTKLVKGKRAITDDDRPTDKHLTFAKSLGIDPGPEWGKFKNYCLAHDKRYANFEAAFRNWLANSVTMNGGKR